MVSFIYSRNLTSVVGSLYYVDFFFCSMLTKYKVGTISGEIMIWDLGSREKLVQKDFKVWDIGVCSMPLQVNNTENPFCLTFDC